jgi:hypothetical protein
LSQAQGDTAANTAVAAGDDSNAPAQVKQFCCWNYFSSEFIPTRFKPRMLTDFRGKHVTQLAGGIRVRKM